MLYIFNSFLMQDYDHSYIENWVSNWIKSTGADFKILQGLWRPGSFNSQPFIKSINYSFFLSIVEYSSLSHYSRFVDKNYTNTKSALRYWH